MQYRNRLINRILYSIDKDQFDDDIIDITIRIDCYIYNIKNSLKLNKIKTINNINVYENSCNISWDYSSLIIEIWNNYIYLLNGNRQLYITEEDINCNHVNDICGKIYHLKKL